MHSTEQAGPSQLKLKEQGVSLMTYIKREARSEDKFEYHNGRIVRKRFARGPHNEITVNITTALKLGIRSVSGTFRVFSSNQKIYLPEVNYGVYPDAVVVSEAPLYWDDDDLLLINPLLVVEVLSKSTRRYDLTGKFELYKSCETFREYVLVRQDTCEVEVRYREQPGLWRETLVTSPGAMVPLRSLGIQLALDDIYENIQFPRP